MRLATYLCTSRHGIYYFRFPIPADSQPGGSRSHIKVSLSTREPREAETLSRLLALAGQAALSQPKVRNMRYDEMRDHVREHFGQLLRDFHERSAADGPASGLDLDALRASQALSQDAPEDWAALSHPNGADGLLAAFCEARGIVPEPEGRERELLLSELQKGYREYIAEALDHTAAFDTVGLAQTASSAVKPQSDAATSSALEPDTLPLADVVCRYFDELTRSEALAAKT